MNETMQSQAFWWLETDDEIQAICFSLEDENLFGNKSNKIEELTKQVEELQNRLSYYENREQFEAGKREEMLSDFTQLTAGYAQMDHGLTNVVEDIKSAADLTKEEGNLTSTLKELLLELVKKLSEDENKVSGLLANCDRESGAFTQMMEKNKHFTTPAKTLSEDAKRLKEGLLEGGKEAEELRDYFKNISVMSLHAAIEAGRLGEAGTGFVQTAEEIRKQSQEKEEQLEALITQVANLTQTVIEVEEQVVHLNSLLKDNTVGMGKLYKDHAAYVEEFKDCGYGNAAKHLTHTSDCVEAIQKSQSQIFVHESHALDEMEKIGDGFIGSKKALVEAETLYRQSMEKDGSAVT